MTKAEHVGTTRTRPFSPWSPAISQVPHRYLTGTSKDDSVNWETDSDWPVSLRSV
jgi:hypothetical protein